MSAPNPPSRMPLPGRVSHGLGCVAVVGLAGLSLLIAVQQGLSHPLPLLSAIVLTLVILRFAVRAVGTFRCEVEVDQDGVVVRNRYQTFWLTWAEIERITTSSGAEDAVTIVTKDGTEIPVTAASPARGMSADGRDKVGAYQRRLRNRLTEAQQTLAANDEANEPD